MKEREREERKGTGKRERGDDLLMSRLEKEGTIAIVEVFLNEPQAAWILLDQPK